MKEVTGELNMTVIVCFSIGILATFFFGTIWPMINHNFEKNTNCKSATCNCNESIRNANNGYCECWTDVDKEHFLCPFGG